MNERQTMVHLTLGTLEGTYDRGVYAFKGVPYAAPPVGSRRWLPPQPVEPWQGVYRADRFREIAPQNPLVGAPMPEGPEPQDEDCLFLNIYTPGLDDRERPVMVWIHGGAFSFGSGSSPVSDGSRLAGGNDVVVVTLNYRLNLLGFLNLNELTAGAIPATGNEGLLDQVAALRWVREHIAVFGGDPGNVTVFGESAGAMSIACLLAMPAAQGAFDKAILESGAGTTTTPLADAVAAARVFLDVAGLAADDVGKIRGLTVRQLLDIESAMRRRMAAPWEEWRITAVSPVVDGRVIAAMPTQLSADGASTGIPVIIGSNLEEWKLFAFGDAHRDSVDRAEIVRRLSAFVPPELVPAIVDRYYEARARRGDSTSPPEVLSAVNTDVMFRMPVLQLVEAHSRHTPRTFNYLFTYRSPVMGGIFGACHALEMGFVFGTHDDLFCGSGVIADRLSRSMQEAWTAFARSGDPSCPSMGGWPPYGDQRLTMIIDTDSHVEPSPYEDERRAWDEVGQLGTVLM